MKLIKRTMLILGSIILSFSISIALLELVLRYRKVLELQRYSSVYNFGEYAIKRFKMSENPLLGWEHDPECKVVHYNSFGNVDKEYLLEKFGNIYRILVLGDSLTEAGIYVDALEDILNKSKLDKIIEVWNCGVGCYDMKNYYYYLLEKAMKYDPDMVIIGLCLNDFVESPIVFSENKKEFIALSGKFCRLRFPINRTLLLNSYAYRFIIIAIDEFIYKNDKSEDVCSNEDISEWAFDMFVNKIKQEDISFLAILIPYFKNDYSKHEQLQYNRILKALEKNNIEYLDLHNAFTNRDDTVWRTKEYPEDFVHPSAEGHRVIAKSIHKYLMDNLDYWYR
ncbi:MAG: SGNH/GDSL hydrolase family protein [Endomicrobiales bacterium]|nr:SGNH/GDSL hydrolase family protein [Endomicrobiales bacterium]